MLKRWTMFWVLVALAVVLCGAVYPGPGVDADPASWRAAPIVTATAVQHAAPADPYPAPETATPVNEYPAPTARATSLPSATPTGCADCAPTPTAPVPQD